MKGITDMYKLLMIVVLAGTLSCLPALSGNPGIELKRPVPAPGLRRADFYIAGIGCPLCFRRLNYVLQHTRGVKEATVIYKKPRRATIIYDSKQTNINEILSQFKQDSILRSVQVFDLHDQALQKTGLRQTIPAKS